MEWFLPGIIAAIAVFLAWLFLKLFLGKPRPQEATARIVLSERIREGGADPGLIPPVAMDEIVGRCIRGVRSWKATGAKDYENEEVAFINRLHHEAALIVEILQGRWKQGGRTYKVLEKHGVVKSH
jgi:hypothetical protein